MCMRSLYKTENFTVHGVSVSSVLSIHPDLGFACVISTKLLHSALATCNRHTHQATRTKARAASTKATADKKQSHSSRKQSQSSKHQSNNSEIDTFVLAKQCQLGQHSDFQGVLQTQPAEIKKKRCCLPPAQPLL